MKINPDKGSREREIAERYDVDGYPVLYVHPRAGSGAIRVSGYRAAEAYAQTLQDALRG